MTFPILYSLQNCPYAMRARLAILLARQTVELRAIVMQDKPAEMLAMSAKGTVPVLILENEVDPDHPGTLITEEFIAPESKVEIVTGSNKVACIEIHDTRMVGEVGFDLMIMEIFKSHGVSYISKVTNANTIDLIVLEKDCSPRLVAELTDTFEVVSVTLLAIVCAIGSNIGQPGIMAKAATALAQSNINIYAVSQTSRQTNMQFIVQREQFAQAQKALHAALCM